MSAPNRAEFIAGLVQSVAMWADESLLGHELGDEAYESEVDILADEIHEEIWHTLKDRSER